MKMLLVVILIIFAILIINELIKKSNWYQIQFGDASKFNNVPDKLQVVNLGSNSGKYGFDYADCGIKGMNWAKGPQTITFDHKILQKYIHFISEDGVVILSISLFSSIKDKYTAKNANNKYYLFLPSEAIPGYSKRVMLEVQMKRLIPVFFLFKNPKSFIRLLRFKKPSFILETNPMNITQLKDDSLKWIEDWKNEFSISKLGTPLSEEHKQIMGENRKILIKIIDLCRKNNLKPVLVIPPVTEFLKYYLTPEIRQIYIYNFLFEVIEQTGIKLLDYIDDIELSDPCLFFNSFFLNARGRKIFTKRVLNDISIS
jgi:hypothetical protein